MSFCEARNQECPRGCPQGHCKTQAERDMGLTMPPLIIPVEVARSIAQQAMELSPFIEVREAAKKRGEKKP